jgi:hypothetical protein
MQRLFVGRLGRVVWLQRSDSGVLQFACRTLKAERLALSLSPARVTRRHLP